MKSGFYYKIDKEAGMAEDIETGEDCDAYIEVKADIADNKVFSVDEYRKLIEGLKKLVVNQLNCDEKYITPITKEEYFENVEEE